MRIRLRHTGGDLCAAIALSIVLCLSVFTAHAQPAPGSSSSTSHGHTLAETIASPETSTRLACAVVLSERRLGIYAPLLTRLSRDPAPRVRLEALHGLARLRSPARLDTLDLYGLPATHQAVLLRRALDEGLLGRRDLARLVARDPAWLGLAGLLEACRLLEDRYGQPPPREVWQRAWALGTPPERLEAAWRMSTPGDGTEPPDSAIGRWLAEEAADLPEGAIAAAFARTGTSKAANAFARNVLTDIAARPDAAIAALDFLLRQDHAAPGMRAAWQRVCAAVPPESGPVLAMVVLRADAAARSRGAASPLWLGDEGLLQPHHGRVRLASRLIRSDAGDSDALLALVRDPDGTFTRPLHAWAEAAGGRPGRTVAGALSDEVHQAQSDPVFNESLTRAARSLDAEWPLDLGGASPETASALVGLERLELSEPALRAERAWLLTLLHGLHARTLAVLPEPVSGPAGPGGGPNTRLSSHGDEGADTLSK